MKYVVLAVVCAFGGFVAAWISFEHMISDGGTHSSPSLITITSSPEQPPRPAYRSATTPTFEDIEQSNSVFEQQYMAWQLASATDIPGLRSLIDKCMGKSDPLYNRNIAAIFLERYIALDPQGAMGFVSGNATMDPLYFIGDVITSWVRYDPRKAVDALKAIANRSIRMRVAAMLLADPEFAQSALADEVKAELGPMGERLLQQIKSRNADPQDLFRQAMLVQGPERRFKLATA
ncbi:MAG TPA: hypothetical protein VJ998_08145, partial [Pseudomonadales bacterium]|nr:hypothetical protein [Pseudomonadales bacterium]